MAKIGLEKIEFYAYHGFYDEERNIGGRYQVDVSVDMTLDKKNWDDNIGQTIDYQLMYAVCEGAMKNQEKLIETVALRIAQGIKMLNDNIASVNVKLKKLNPPIYGQIGSAFVEINI